MIYLRILTAVLLISLPAWADTSIREEGDQRTLQHRLTKDDGTTAREMYLCSGLGYAEAACSKLCEGCENPNTLAAFLIDNSLSGGCASPTSRLPLVPCSSSTRSCGRWAADRPDLPIPDPDFCGAWIPVEVEELLFGIENAGRETILREESEREIESDAEGADP